MMLNPIYVRTCDWLMNWVEGWICKTPNLIPTPPDPPSAHPPATSLPPPPPPSPPTPSPPSPHAEEALLELQRENENLKGLLAEAKKEMEERVGQEKNNQRNMLQLQLQACKLSVEVAILRRTSMLRCLTKLIQLHSIRLR